MTQPKTKAPSAAVVAKSKKERSTAVEVDVRHQDDMHAAVARTLIRPEVNAAAAMEQWQKDTHDVNALV